MSRAFPAAPVCGAGLAVCPDGRFPARGVFIFAFLPYSGGRRIGRDACARKFAAFGRVSRAGRGCAFFGCIIGIIIRYCAIMRKISLMAISVAALFAGACTTNVVVDSRAFPMASYDEISGSFTGKLAGNINSAFKSANIALERDLKYFRVGQIPGDNSWLIYARAELDIKIVVSLKQLPNDEVEVSIDYGDGNLMKSQQIFNAIAKNMRMFEGR